MKKAFIFVLCSLLLLSCLPQKQESIETDQKLSNAKVAAPTKENTFPDEIPPTIITLDDISSMKDMEQTVKDNKRTYTYSDSQNTDGSGINLSVKITIPNVAPRDDSKERDYSNLPNYEANLSPSTVVEYYLTNLAGGRLSEAKKFASESTTRHLLFYGKEDRNPIIENYDLNILEETINGEEATVKTSDTMGESTVTLNKIEGEWIIMRMR